MGLTLHFNGISHCSRCIAIRLTVYGWLQPHSECYERTSGTQKLPGTRSIESMWFYNNWKLQCLQFHSFVPSDNWVHFPYECIVINSHLVDRNVEAHCFTPMGILNLGQNMTISETQGKGDIQLHNLQVQKCSIFTSTSCLYAGCHLGIYTEW